MRSTKLLAAVATLAMLGTWVMPVAAQTSTVNNAVNQDTSGFIINGGFQQASIGDDAFQNATGSVGMNNAAGSLNQQANQLYVNQTSGELNLNSQNTQDQSGSSVDTEGDYASGNNAARYKDNAFQHASGNIGANNAAGNLNQQQNTATILSSCNNQCGNGPEVNSGIITLDQTTSDLALNGAHFDGQNFVGSTGSNDAHYQDSAFAGASGNIGANNAAGNMNQQGNQLVLLTNGEMENLQIGLMQDNSDNGDAFNAIANDSHNVATYDGAFANASGNIGVNNAAGDMNQQANQAVLNVAAKPAPTATQPPEGPDPLMPVSLTMSQLSTGTVTNAGEQNAEYAGNSFQNASGNIGANNAAGTLNQQQNQLYLDVLAEELALSIDDSQSQSGFVVDDSGAQNLSAGNNYADFRDNAFQMASGNIGANNAAGNGNQQQNGAAIFANTCVNSCGGGTELQGGNGTNIVVSQDSEGNTYVGHVTDLGFSEPANGNNVAYFLSNAFQNAVGNVGANQASGNMNQQANQLVLVTNGELEDVGAAAVQLAVGNFVNHDTLNVATFEANAFQNATGNIGVNNAAGDLNQQVNIAVINEASKTPTTPKSPPGPDAASNVNNGLGQFAVFGAVYDAGNQTAVFKGSAFSNATGNVGANNAAGTENQQANSLYIDRLAESVNLSVADSQFLAGTDMTSPSFDLTSDANGNQRAVFENNVFSNATGNIGANNAAGNANQQQNSTLILQNVCADPTTCGAGPQVNGGNEGDSSYSLDLNQVSLGNFYDGGLSADVPPESEGNDKASFQDNAFQNASGNIGANNSAGNMNQQSNMMVLITNGTLSNLSAHIGQQSFNLVLMDTGNTASFQGNAFQNATGNVSANNAAGDLNQQANQTIINTKP